MDIASVIILTGDIASVICFFLATDLVPNILNYVKRDLGARLEWHC